MKGKRGPPAKPPAKGRKGKAAPAEDAAPADANGATADGAPDAKTETGRNGKAVVIVESPAKARTINKYLGREYIVKASMGHVRDLPKSKLGVDPDKNFAVTYVPIKDRDKVLKELKDATAHARAVYLAPDPDREGEAIAWHLAEALKIPRSRVHRVTFNEITKKAVQEAFQHPTQINMDRVYAQQARRVLDRIVGYKLSPLLWSKIVFGLSAGRVQSVAVRLICEREVEIRAFRSDEYWTILSRATGAAAPTHAVELQLKEWEGKPADLTVGPASAGAAEAARAGKGDAHPDVPPRVAAIVAALRAAPHVVTEVKRTEKTERARPPFTTSLLQQQGSIRLRYTAKRTMRLAQQLYEGIPIGEEGPTGLITYMRTDSTRISADAQSEARALISERYGADYVPATPNMFRDSAKAQGAHEAIRPTSARRTPESLARYLSTDQLRLYTLIWQRFVSSQMAPARVAATQVRVTAGPGLLTAEGREVVFPGYLKALPAQRGEQPDLPKFREGETLTVQAVEPSQHFTQPPPRYSEATLVKALEKNGIGRPSTYAPIISTVQARGYVKLDQRRFHATPIGELVTELLVKHFPRILDVEFTSKMEANLDEIEAAKADWVDVLREFNDVFEKSLARAKVEMRDVKKTPEPSPHTCPACGKMMVYRINRHGRYLGCSTWPACKQTVPLDDAGTPTPPRKTDVRCPLCDKPMLLRTARGGSFLGCSGYPECRCTLPVDADGKPLFPARNGEPCPLCGKKMIVRSGRRGPFLACTGYPECKSTKPLGDEADLKPPATPDGKPITCEDCGKPLAWRRGRRGLFLGCTGYPECKKTRPAPKELLPQKVPKGEADEPAGAAVGADEADPESGTESDADA